MHRNPVDASLPTPLIEQPGIAELLITIFHPAHRPVRYPAISAASSQLIFFAIAFGIMSCSFIVRSIAAALNDPGFIKPQHRRRFVERTDH